MNGFDFNKINGSGLGVWFVRVVKLLNKPDFIKRSGLSVSSLRSSYVIIYIYIYIYIYI